MQEARVLGGYLVHREIPDVLVRRYGKGVASLALAETAWDRAILAWAVRHPWSVGWLDAGCGALGVGRAFRQRILLMTAILETTPEFAGAFDAAPRVWAGAVAGLLMVGARAAVRIVGGVLLIGVAIAPRVWFGRQADG